MNGRDEYIGRALNVACRLQSGVKDQDKSPAYKALVSSLVFYEYFKDLPSISRETVKLPLRNIRGGAKFKCHKLILV